MTLDLTPRVAVTEERLREHDRRLDGLERRTDQMLEQGNRLLAVSEAVGKGVDMLWDAQAKHTALGAHQAGAERLAKLEAESVEHRRNISRLWKWGSGAGAAVTGAAAALARWWG